MTGVGESRERSEHTVMGDRRWGMGAEACICMELIALALPKDQHAGKINRVRSRMKDDNIRKRQSKRPLDPNVTCKVHLDYYT